MPNKEISEKQLNNVIGGMDEADSYVDVKCVITYRCLENESSDNVVLKVLSVNGETLESKIYEAVIEWCDKNAYQYIDHIVIHNDGYFVV